LRVSFRWLGRAARFRFAPAYTLHGIPSAHRQHCRVTAGQSARRTASGSSAEREKGVARNTARRVSCRILPGRRIHATLCACTRHVTGKRSTPPLGRMDLDLYEPASDNIPALKSRRTRRERRLDENPATPDGDSVRRQDGDRDPPHRGGCLLLRCRGNLVKDRFSRTARYSDGSMTPRDTENNAVGSPREFVEPAEACSGFSVQRCPRRVAEHAGMHRPCARKPPPRRSS
jgi:hypothetical protein